jgi:uncharacterized protein (DUF58 family)
MSSLINRVKTKLFIASYKKSLHALDGQYVSAMRGRSMDFDDLREYTSGDEVKDIDWKASARSATPLVKQYIANRKQPVLFVTDGSKSMQAVTESNETKKDLVISIVGVLGYLAIRHSDSVGLLTTQKETMLRIPNKETETHLERILQAINYSVEHPSSSSFIDTLKYIQNTVKNRTLLVIVADETPVTQEMESLLKRLHAQHEVLWVSVGDGDPLSQVPVGKGTVEDILTGAYIPDYIRLNKKLKDRFKKREAERKENINNVLNRIDISHTTIGSQKIVIPRIISLLERRIRERRR